MTEAKLHWALGFTMETIIIVEKLQDCCCTLHHHNISQVLRCVTQNTKQDCAACSPMIAHQWLDTKFQSFTLYTHPLQLLSRLTIFECTGPQYHNNWCVIIFVVPFKSGGAVSLQTAQHMDEKQNKNKTNKTKLTNKEQLYFETHNHDIATPDTNDFVSEDQWCLYCSWGFHSKTNQKTIKFHCRTLVPCFI